MKTITLLGSTGSIGTSTLDVVRLRPELFKVHSLAAGQNWGLLANQITEFRPSVAVVATEQARDFLSERLSELGMPKTSWPDLLWGPEALVEVASEPAVNFVLSAIVGVAGLEATYEATRLGKRIGLANKETLVASGQLVMDASRKHNATVIPVDSEHNGAHQCLRAGRHSEVVKLILTASGGPFRTTERNALECVTPAQALKHPTWKMGQRITIDSATLMNKGFEVIEACWLFGFRADQVDVVVHPQSIVHAMVEYCDGSVVAQVCATDMRMPIQYALTYPDREDAPVPRLSWKETRQWDFHAPDLEKFPALRLAYEAFETGGSAPCVLNAADEVAVQAFLDEQISFPAIAEIVEETLNRIPARTPLSIPEVLEVDGESRRVAQQLVRQREAVRA